MVNYYEPDRDILDKYANLLVNYALNSGEGMKAGEVVQIFVPDIAKSLARSLQNAVLEAGGHPLLRLAATGLDKDYYERASEEQLKFFPKEYLFAKAELIDHQVGVIADPFPYELKDIDPAKFMLARNSKKAYRDKLVEKENRGEFTWTIALWATEAKADMVNLTLEDYWQQIIKACYLDKQDPIAEWQEISKLQEEIKQKLNNLDIDTINVKGDDMDITYKLGEKRKWVGGSGRNIPSFEIFTSPDWRGTNGWIRFNQPLYRYGNVLENIELQFKDGKVTKASAETGESLLTEMLNTENADKVGEISLTDKRMSRITHVMAETLFDENMGGQYGNHHLALGRSYHDCYDGDPSQPNAEDWENMGFNDSAEHTDIITTTDRTVTAKLKSGQKIKIYEGGSFVL
jgi:aminopeptidase